VRHRTEIRSPENRLRVRRCQRGRRWSRGSTREQDVCEGEATDPRARCPSRSRLSVVFGRRLRWSRRVWGSRWPSTDEFSVVFGPASLKRPHGGRGRIELRRLPDRLGRGLVHGGVSRRGVPRRVLTTSPPRMMKIRAPARRAHAADRLSISTASSGCQRPVCHKEFQYALDG
jgi:hypothetical protein